MRAAFLLAEPTMYRLLNDSTASTTDMPDFLAPCNPVAPDMVRVGEDQQGTHPPGNIDRFHHIEARRNDLRHTQHEEMALLGRDLDAGDHENR